MLKYNRTRLFPLCCKCTKPDAITKNVSVKRAGDFVGQAANVSTAQIFMEGVRSWMKLKNWKLKGREITGRVKST